MQHMEVEFNSLYKITEMAALYPDEPAIVEYQGRKFLYKEIEQETNRLANCLIDAGISKDEIIPIIADKRVDTILSIIAILKAGGVFVPLDPKIQDKRLEHIIEELSPRWIISVSDHFSRIEQLAITFHLNLTIIALDQENSVSLTNSGLKILGYKAYSNQEKPNVTINPKAWCYTYYTSGSTGTPKGIKGCLKGIDHFVQWEINTLGLEKGIRVSQLYGPGFDASLRDIFVPLCSGGTICIPPNYLYSQYSYFAEWLNQEQINILHCARITFDRLLSNIHLERLDALKNILIAGEALSPKSVKKWMDIFGNRIQLIHLYGPTETTMLKTAYFVQSGDYQKKKIPIGKPLPEVQLFLINEQNELCSNGEPGEICIQPPFPLLGYFNRPDLNKKQFVNNPFSKDIHQVMYKTGDWGKVLEDGNYAFLGRKDQQVKILGYRIELGEIESVLSSYIQIQDAVVTLQKGTSTDLLIAFLIAEKQQFINEAKLKIFLKERLPDYMIPSIFIILDSFPITLNGKINRKALAAWHIPTKN